MLGLALFALLCLQQRMATAQFLVRLSAPTDRCGRSESVSFRNSEGLKFRDMLIHCERKDAEFLGARFSLKEVDISMGNFFHGDAWRKEYKYEDCKLTVVLYIIREGKTRANENPLSFHVPDFLKKHLQSSVEPGTGLDFGEMYNLSPFIPVFRIYKQAGSSEILFDGSFPNCTSTSIWIANEGVYAYDVEARELFPLYYYPFGKDLQKLT